MDSAISFGLNKLNYDQLREYQSKGVVGYLNGQDVFLCSPTGSGKSLLFEIAPFVLSYRYHHEKLPNLTSSVVVVSPLVSLMKTLGLKAAYLSDITGHRVESEDTVSMKDIVCGNFDILLCSPESVLGEHRSIIKNLSECHILRAIFIDEAHCITKFGKPCPVTKRPAFRPAYGKLGELRSLAGAETPVIALTATATLETQKTLIKDLCMGNCIDIILSPNKKNNRYDVIEMKSDDTRENFEWLVKLLDMKGIDTPRIIVFFRRVEHMSVVFKHVINTLGRKAYVNYKEDGPNDDRNRLIDMFHMKTSDIVKSSICQSYADPCGHIRVVLCTTSFSMGLDVKDSSKVAKERKLTTAGKIVLGLSGSVVVGVCAVTLPFVSPALRRICLPYVPASTAQVQNVIAALKGRGGSVLDIGSGDGRIVIETAKHGFRSYGVELNWWLVLYSRYHAWRQGQKNARFYRKDLWKTDLRKYDNIVIFGVQQMMSQLETKFDEELHRDSHVVACRFPLPTWQPVNTCGHGIDTVWVYKHPSNTDYTRIAKPLIDSDGNAFNESDSLTSESDTFRTLLNKENQTSVEKKTNTADGKR